MGEQRKDTLVSGTMIVPETRVSFILERERGFKYGIADRPCFKTIQR